MNKLEEWWNWNGGFVTACLVFIFIIVILTLALLGVGKKTCIEQTRALQVDSYWSNWAGCMVEVEEGKWIPLENYYWRDE